MPALARFAPIALGMAVAGIAATSALAASGACRAANGARAPVVVELFTSEGCSSCPPADRWLSTLKGRDDVLALAFHVDYWDRLGWTDRFASVEATARQVALSQLDGSGVYTPQVRANGRDWRIWPRLPEASAEPAPPLSLVREGDTVTAQVGTLAGRRLAGYWAVIEDRHQSAVKAGENAGETLRHDHVVRLVRPVAPWAGGDGLRSQIGITAGVPEHPRRVVFVVTDAATQRPVQAVALAC